VFGAISIFLSLVVWMIAPVESAIHQSTVAAQIAVWLIATYASVRAIEMICKYFKALTKTKHLRLLELSIFKPRILLPPVPPPIARSVE
jgi:hypothetical protein